MNNKNNKNNTYEFVNWNTLFPIIAVISLILITIILTGIFHSGPIIRSNILFNAIGGFAMAFVFIWVIFRFMGSSITIFGKSFDVGMIVYIFIVCFVIFILGN